MQAERSTLKKKLIIRYVMAFLLLCLFFFLPAGTFKFWQAWVYMATLFIPIAFVGIYFFRKNPEFLERRMRLHEKEKAQQNILRYSTMIFFIGLLIPGLDHRFQWSNVPVYLVLVADLMALFSYLLIIKVFQFNQFAARTIEVEENQGVISNGPYAFMRHPMYTGMILMYLFTPLALGSYWGLIPFLFLPVVMVYRIKNEEEVLKKELPGYKEYCRKTRYRLIPLIW